MEKNTPLYFLHIPKTAGTTLTSIIDAQFLQNRIFPIQKWPDFFSYSAPLAQSSSYDLFRGHFGYGFYRYIGTRPKFLTMLRNPLDQLVSLYFHQMISVKNNRPRASKLFSGKESLLDVFANPIQRIMFTNFQVKYFALDIDVPLIHQMVCKIKNINSKFLITTSSLPTIDDAYVFPTLNLSILDFVSMLEDNAILDDFIEFPNIDLLIPALSDEKLLSLAKVHLSKFDFFGIVEQMPESIELLCSTFNWNVPDTIPYQNQSTIRHNDILDDYTVSKIKQYSKLDQQLYDYAKSLFQKHCSYE